MPHLSSDDLRSRMVADAKRLAAKAEQWYREKPEHWGMPTGIPSLDDMTGGLPMDEIIVLAGGPGMGKTALATQMALTASRKLRQEPPAGADTINVFISAEMSRAQIMQRIGCSHARIDQTALRRGQISAEQLQDYQDALVSLCELPLLVADSNEPFTSEDVQQLVKGLLAEGLQVGVLVVDYLQQLGDEGMGVERLNGMLRRLRAVTHEASCALLLLSQYARVKSSSSPSDTGRSGRPRHRKPTMDDLLGSGNIERTADQIWALNDPEEGTENIAYGVSRKHLYVLKNRNGKKHKPSDYPIDLDFYEAFTTFVDPRVLSVEDVDRVDGVYRPPLALVK